MPDPSASVLSRSSSRPSTPSIHPATPNPSSSTPAPPPAKSKEPTPAAPDDKIPDDKIPDDAASATSTSTSDTKKRPSTHDLHLDQYVQRDQLAAAVLAGQFETQNSLLRKKRVEAEQYHRLKQERGMNPVLNAGQLYGAGYMGYGNGFTDGKTRVVYPIQRRRPGGRKVRELWLSRKEQQQVAETKEELVPIRLDIDVDKFKLRDTFNWNLHDKTVPVELFAEQLVEDFHLPLTPQLVRQVADSIQEQLNEYHPHVFLPEEGLDPKLPYWAYKNDDMRVCIKLNITIGQHTLVDQFEWDLNNPQNSPEEFAGLLTRDMALSGEFTTAITHSIREQCQLFTRALYVMGHPFDGRPIEDEDIRSAMLPSPLPNVIRTQIQAKDYTPTLFLLSEADLERAEKSQSREARAMNRQRRVRRGGPTIPDLKDMPKTHRSQIVSSVLPGAVARIEDLEKARRPKVLKDGESDDEESSSENEELPPEKAIRGWENMTRRQRMAALAAMQKQSMARSMTPEVHHTPSRLERQINREREREQREREIREREQRATATAEPMEVEKTYAALPRRPGAPPDVDSGVCVLRCKNKSRFIKLIGEIDRRAAMGKLEAQRKALEEQRAREREAKRLTETPVAPPPAPVVPQIQQQQQRKASATKAPAKTAPIPTPPAPAPTQAAAPPPPPQWLSSSLAALRSTYPLDRFEETMRSAASDPSTGQQVAAAQIPTVQAALKEKGLELQWNWVPRIRCSDCPGKLYTPGPEETCDNFLMHLRNRQHRTKVDARLAAEKEKEKGEKGEKKDG